MSVANSFLAQEYRQTSVNKVHLKDDWLRQVKYSLIFSELNIICPCQIEINTCTSPHRRLWMGPQFQFKHYSEATAGICSPNSTMFSFNSPRPSMNIIEADLKSLP